jgi:Glucose/sorbosone dehydrogenases
MTKLIVVQIVFVLAAFAIVNAFSQGVSAPYTARLQTVLTGLNRPILLRSSPDNTKRLFVVQQTGQILVVEPGMSVATTFIDLSSKIFVPTSTGDERGLLGLAFHPQFSTNGKFYVDYTRAGDGTTVIAEYKINSGNPNQGDISTERVLLTIPQPFANHNGGMVEFGPDGYFYIGMGDGGSANDPGNRAQNPAQLLGKLLRIDVNIPMGSPVPYLIPPTNPFTGPGTVRCDGGSTTNGQTCQELWTIGMRNPWRYSFDRVTGAQWVADVGQGTREEVDVITSGGGNYGWRVYEGSLCTGNDPGLCNPNNYIFPIFDYTHINGRCSITGGYVYRGLLGSMPQGAYAYGDYCSGELFMWNNNASTVLLDTPRSITSFGEDNRGEVYICYPNGLNNQGQIDRITRAKASADFDGDLKTDISVYRPSTGTWYINHSSNGTNRFQNFGLAEDIPVPADYDGDNITDIGVFRPSTGVWYNFRSSDSTAGIVSTGGTTGDVPVAADFDGDAKADYAYFHPANGNWTVMYTHDPSGVSTINFGLSGDIPAVSDFDGDGIADIAIFRPSTGDWWWIPSGKPNGTGFGSIHWGTNGDIPVPGDFDGDLRADIAVFRPSTGVWYILNSSNGSAQIGQWGTNGDVPIVGDYDGDGKDDVAVFRPSTGVWYIQRSSDGSFQYGQWGSSGDLPAPKYDAP